MSKILIVDDEKSIRITLKAFLSAEGFDVTVSADAQEAEKILKRDFFDVVVTDIILPRITGVELLKMIKEISPKSKVIMMTGEPTAETASASKEFGAEDYLSKPVGKEKILESVKNVLKKGFS